MEGCKEKEKKKDDIDFVLVPTYTETEYRVFVADGILVVSINLRATDWTSVGWVQKGTRTHPHPHTHIHTFSK